VLRSPRLADWRSTIFEYQTFARYKTNSTRGRARVTGSIDPDSANVRIRSIVLKNPIFGRRPLKFRSHEQIGMAAMAESEKYLLIQ
jgi:hypothetical protein